MPTNTPKVIKCSTEAVSVTATTETTIIITLILRNIVMVITTGIRATGTISVAITPTVTADHPTGTTSSSTTIGVTRPTTTPMQL
jgi:hypothetical protein